MSIPNNTSCGLFEINTFRALADFPALASTRLKGSCVNIGFVIIKNKNERIDALVLMGWVMLPGKMNNRLVDMGYSPMFVRF